MSQITYRGNLSAKAFPFLTDFQGRTVIVPGPDNTFNRSLVSSEDLDRDVGVPTAFYMHNALPTSYGFQSVGYETLIPGVILANTFESIELIRTNRIGGVNGPRVYFSILPSGAIYTLSIGSSAWSLSVTVLPLASGTQISFATVQGITYIYFSGIGCYKFDTSTNALISVDLTGLVATSIRGITTFQGYLIAYDTSTIYWSSTLDIDYTTNNVDFVPSLATGASSLTLEGARGDITFVIPAAFGIACYTTTNIVSGVYSGNSRFPFNFREIISSGGCISSDLVAYDSNTGNQYAYTTSGMQTLTATASQTIFPEITDFLAGQIFEDFNETTLTFSETVLTVPMRKKITAVADRYLIFSYGTTSLTHAIVYDMAQRRYGKLKIAHVDCFEYEYLDPGLADSPRKSIAFLTAGGEIRIANLSESFGTSSGVIILGKFQYVRSRMLTMEEIILQNVRSNQSLSVYDLVSLSGGTLASTTRVAALDKTAGNAEQKVYKLHKTGQNHCILLVGGFSLASFVLSFHVNGDR